MYQWYNQGSSGAPPHHAYFMVEADGPDPNDPTYVPTWRIRTLRHVNESPDYRSVLFLYQTINGVVTEVVTDQRPPETSRDATMPMSSNYLLSDDSYGYRFGWVDRGSWKRL